MDQDQYAKASDAAAPRFTIDDQDDAGAHAPDAASEAGLHIPGRYEPPYVMLASADDELAAAAGSSVENPVTAERLLYEREQAHFNDIYLLSPVAHFVLGFDTTILQMNLAAADLLGIARVLHGGHHFRSFISSRFLVDFDQFMQRSLNSKGDQRVQLQMARGRHEQGFPVTLQACPDSTGQALRLVVELAEGAAPAVQRSEERLRRVVHSAEEGVWEIDAAGCTSFVNPKMADLLGYPIEHMLGRPLVAFMDEEGRSLLERNIARRQDSLPERHEFKFLRSGGEPLWVNLVTHPIFDGAGSYRGALALVSDITERKESSELMWQQANFDTLTGLPNRHMFLDRLGIEAKKARRDGVFLALLFIDLDDFKQVNDRLGHDQGDVLLADAARRIAACVRGTDTVARLGGDEFTVILPGLEHVDSVERVAQKVVATLAQPFALDGDSVLVSASIGIALLPADATDVEALMRHADQAMYAAKAGGRNRYSYFTPDLQAAAQLRVRTTLDLRTALAAQQFELHYQPIVHLQTGAVHRAEALLRWRHPQRGLLAPAEFIPFAESSGLIIEIGDWVFRQAAEQAQRWQAEIDPGFQISVNKSPVQFRSDAAFYASWLAHLEALHLPRGSVIIEITEAILLDGAPRVIERLRQFHSMGLQVALDDFGTGYSSLSQLKKFAIDFVKIDRSFVQRLESDAGDLALCEAIIAMAHKLGLQVVAEGVETAAQCAMLTQAGCDFAQGYHFARAMPAAQFLLMAQAATPCLAS